MLLGIGERIYAASHGRDEGPDSEDDQNGIGGGDSEQERDCGGLHGDSSYENMVR